MHFLISPFNCFSHLLLTLLDHIYSASHPCFVDYWSPILILGGMDDLNLDEPFF